MAKKSAKGGSTIRKKTVTRSGKEYTYWEGRITVGRDPGTGKQIQRSITGKTQKEVREKLQAVAVEISRGTYQAPNKITVSAWMEEWLATFCANKVKPLTLQSYAAIIKKHIAPALGAVELQAVRGAQIQRLYNSMTRAGLSGKTVKNVSAIMHKAFSVALKQGIIAANPCDAAELPKAEHKEIRPLADSEIPRFLAAIDGAPMRNAFALCLFAGFREGECLGLSGTTRTIWCSRMKPAPITPPTPSTSGSRLSRPALAARTRGPTIYATPRPPWPLPAGRT